MLTWKDVVVEEQRREDLQQQAARRQILRLARGNEPQTYRLHHVVLVRVGAWLENWGCRLQARYSNLDAASSLTPNRTLAAAGGDDAAGC